MLLSSWSRRHRVTTPKTMCSLRDHHQNLAKLLDLLEREIERFDRAALADADADTADPLFGIRVARDFQVLRDDILAMAGES
jgi:hypothetical protein